MKQTVRRPLSALIAAAAAALAVSVAGPAVFGATPVSTVANAATANKTAVRVTPPPGSGGHFATLPPNAALPTDEQCAAAVRPAPETVPTNAVYNQTKGTGNHPKLTRVNGNFTGTTDELMQWAACKWGIDEDVVRAQMMLESWWDQRTADVFTTDQSVCHPLFRTASGPCPEAIGFGQIRYQFHTAAFDNNNAIKSSAYNLDYTYGMWRNCFNGTETWVNDHERGAEYGPGDEWGCIGLWYSGRWRDAEALGYIAKVQDFLATRKWTIL
jgi:hypothetical protein